MTNEIMNMEQLDAVSGGTCQETDELISALGVQEVGRLHSRRRLYNPQKYPPRTLTRGEVAACLKMNYGISADTSNSIFLWFGDGRANKYTDIKTGQALTHNEVLNRIRR